MSSGATFHCRVQYLDDIDPFSSTTNSPEPLRPPKYTFINNITLSDQIPGVHRILNPPHQVNDSMYFSVHLVTDSDSHYMRNGTIIFLWFLLTLVLTH